MTQTPTQGPAGGTQTGAPAGPAVDYAERIKHHLRRALSWNLQAVPLEKGEGPALATAGVTNDTMQRYFAWRRSLLLCVTVPLAVSAGLAVYDLAKTDLSGMTGLGKAVAWARVGALCAMPLAAWMAAQVWTNPGESATRVFKGWAVAFVVPVAAALVPLEMMVNLAGVQGGGEALQGARFLQGVGAYFTLLPLVLSLLPALVRACVRVKTLAPGAIVPGWFLMGAAPLNMMLWLVAFVAINSMIGDLLLVAGVGLFIAAPMAYLKRADLFVRPRVGGEINAIGVQHKAVVTMMVSGIGVVVLFLFTHKIGGVTIMGMNKGTSMMRPWDIDLWKFVLDYLARSFFMTALFADLLLRVSAAAHRDSRAFEEDPAAKDHDAFMGVVQTTLPKGKLGI